MLRKIRIILAAAFFTGVTLLFLDFTGTLHSWEATEKLYERHCPSGAISMVRRNPDQEVTLMIPVVDEEKCIGCGACENLCPARPFTAIHVEGHEIHKEI